jgi:hypothetical protein
MSASGEKWFALCPGNSIEDPSKFRRNSIEALPGQRASNTLALGRGSTPVRGPVPPGKKPLYEATLVIHGSYTK